MEEWVVRAMQRWPNVPALFGWLGLDRRGRWLIRDEPISHPQIVRVIGANYASDEHGRWFFQNGPQRGYMKLAYAPYVLRAVSTGDALTTHNELPVEHVKQAFMDEEGTLVLRTEHGAGLISDQDADWVLQRLRNSANAAANEDELARALAVPSGGATELSLIIGSSHLAVTRLDAAQLPAMFGFVRDPQPRPGERTSAGAPD